MMDAILQVYEAAWERAPVGFSPIPGRAAEPAMAGSTRWGNCVAFAKAAVDEARRRGLRASLYECPGHMVAYIEGSDGEAWIVDNQFPEPYTTKSIGGFCK